jgi:hypothetical protein
MLGTGAIIAAGVSTLANQAAAKNGTTTATETKGILGTLEGWGENALVAGEKLLFGIGATFTEAQFGAIKDAAVKFKQVKTAGGTATDAWNAAYAVLGQDESVAFSEAELGLADAIISIFSVTPNL